MIQRNNSGLRVFQSLAVFLLLTGSAIAQSTAHPKFEVASIKPASGASGTNIRTAPDGRVNLTNMNLRQVIALAWHIQTFQISGGPAWLESAHYDISAKVDPNTQPREIALMLQALLQEKFQLKLHGETNELPIYALVVVKDAKIRPGLIESRPGSCAPADQGKPSIAVCGGMTIGPYRVSAASISISDLTPLLARIVGRLVVDKTSLPGKFDVHLEWAADATGSSVLKALQEQLGLKLESQTGPVEMFVIDRAEKPAEN